VLFTRARRHEEALALLVWKMGHSQEQMVEYCKQYDSEDTPSASLLLKLLKVYMNPPQGQAARQDDALELLERCGTVLDPVGVLNELPPTMPIKMLSQFLERAMPAHSHEICMTKIECSMTKSRHAEVHEELWRMRRHRVVVDAKRTCEVCKRKLGAGVAVCVIPNGKMVHHACLPADRYHICPITFYNFETGAEEADLMVEAAMQAVEMETSKSSPPASHGPEETSGIEGIGELRLSLAEAERAGAPEEDLQSLQEMIADLSHGRASNASEGRFSAFDPDAPPPPPPDFL